MGAWQRGQRALTLPCSVNISSSSRWQCHRRWLVFVLSQGRDPEEACKILKQFPRRSQRGRLQVPFGLGTIFRHDPVRIVIHAASRIASCKRIRLPAVVCSEFGNRMLGDLPAGELIGDDCVQQVRPPRCRSGHGFLSFGSSAGSRHLLHRLCSGAAGSGVPLSGAGPRTSIERRNRYSVSERNLAWLRAAVHWSRSPALLGSLQ